jgi:hypothetical protein
LALQNVALSARNILGVTGIDKLYLKAAAFTDSKTGIQ